MGRNLENYKAWLKTYEADNADAIREANRERQRRSRAAKPRKPKSIIPFLAVDGEGGTGPDGKHVYTYIRAGERTLYRPEGIQTYHAVAFLHDALSNQIGIPVSFFFNYDVSMICKGLPAEKIESLCDRDSRQLDEQYYKKVWVGDYGIDWLPDKFFTILRKNRAVMISDTASFFQCSFIKALDDWEIGTVEERESIRADKARRNTFTAEMTEREKAYNELECRLLEQLMSTLRDTCYDLDINLRRWQGAGSLASAMLNKTGAPKRKEHVRPAGIVRAAQNAYYGGRFEAAQAGPVEGVYQADIASAYPHAMTQGLPCPVHTRWHKRKELPGPLSEDIYVAHISWCRDDRRGYNGVYGPLPWRTTGGSIMYPEAGAGWYWSPELQAARARWRIRPIGAVWIAERKCDCNPWTWIPDRYKQRLELGKSAKGKVLKLGLNSLYGKLAQSVGSAPYADAVCAGLITSRTRARLLNVFNYHSPSSVVMFATDAVYLSEQPAMPGQTTTKELGGWEVSEPANLLLVQPGFYFHETGAEVKSRGIPRQIIAKEYDAFLSAWQKEGYYGNVTINCGHNFLGIREAVHRNNPAIAGCWIPESRTISFELKPKRVIVNPRGGLTAPYVNAGGAESTPYPKRFGLPPALADQTVWEHPNGNHPFTDLLPEWES